MTAANVNFPRPGRLKILSVTNAPPNKNAKSRPAIVTIGTKAARMTYLTINVLRFNPLASPRRTNSSFITSRIPLRVMRTYDAADTIAKTNQGKINDVIHFQGFSVMPLYWGNGSSPVQITNTMIDISPRKNVGKLTPMTLKPVATRSCHFPLLRAAKVPRPTPIKIHKVNAPIAIEAVTGNVFAMRVVTHSWRSYE